jgi:putative integral membrane protein (TIGR02587 family)
MDLRNELNEQGRGMAGALIVLGISFVFTNEAWWLAIQLPAVELVAVVCGGLALVVPIVRSVGFRSDDAEDGSRTDETPLYIVFGELLFQSLLVAYVTLFLLGLVTPDQSISTVVRMGLVFVVPLAFGAALANELLSGEQEELSEAGFPRDLGVFALGAIFFSAPIAPTEEIVSIAARVSWAKVGATLAFSLVSTFLILHVLEFRGQSERLQNRSLSMQVAQACMVYLIGTVVAVVLLQTVGVASGQPLSDWVRQSVVLAFPSTIGASAARVVLS